MYVCIGLVQGVGIQADGELQSLQLQRHWHGGTFLHIHTYIHTYIHTNALIHAQVIDGSEESGTYNSSISNPFSTHAYTPIGADGHGHHSDETVRLLHGSNTETDEDTIL
jgi:hypothetical protein